MEIPELKNVVCKLISWIYRRLQMAKDRISNPEGKIEENIQTGAQRSKRIENTEKSKRDIKNMIIRSNLCDWCARRGEKENGMFILFEEKWLRILN